MGEWNERYDGNVENQGWNAGNQGGNAGNGGWECGECRESGKWNGNAGNKIE